MIIVVTISCMVIGGLIIGLTLRKLGVPDDSITRWMPATVSFFGMLFYGLYENLPIHIVLLVSAASFIYAKIIVTANLRYQADKKSRQKKRKKTDKTNVD